MPFCSAASARERPSITNAIARRRRTCAPSPHLLTKLRSSDAVRSKRVIGIAALIRCLLGRESPPGHQVERSRNSEPRRVNVNAGSYYTRLGYWRVAANSVVEIEDGTLVDITPHEARGHPFIRHKVAWKGSWRWL